MLYPRLVVFTLCLSILSLWSCDPTPDPFQPYFQEDYYPLAIGRSWTYQMDSVVYTPTGDSVAYLRSNQLREVVVDTFTDGTGTLQYRIEQFTRPDDTSIWESRQVLSAWLEDQRAFRNENNLTFIKAIFPPEEFQRWDGNSLIDPNTEIRVGGELVVMFKGWDYETQAVGATENVGSQSYEEVLTIVPSLNENLIELREVEEKYARGVGLVYRKLRILDSQNIDPSLSWEERAEQGFILMQTLIEFQ
ncbi:MAG: hypothetical protein AAGH79_17015 [Bacteroidota bacterium]